MKRCPKCGKEHDSSPWLCDCGYEFSGAEPDESSPPDTLAGKSGRLSFIAIAILAAGTLFGLLIYLPAHHRGTSSLGAELFGSALLRGSSILAFFFGVGSLLSGERPIARSVLAVLLPLAFLIFFGCLRY